MKHTHNPFIRIWHFYIEGFRNMTWGRTLWIIILLKLFIMFVILRVFFFQPALAGKSEAEKQHTVATSLSGERVDNIAE